MTVGQHEGQEDYSVDTMYDFHNKIIKKALGSIKTM